jgi:peptidoglycan/xylan/chitin deacetylase (PgdA/CDA1 family)
MGHDQVAPPFVLMYHSVDQRRTDPHQITVSPSRFARQMSWLRRRGMCGTSMRELLEAVEAGSAAGLVGLTFDDGYADFAAHVLPVLGEHGFGATAFVVASRLGGQSDWDAVGARKPLMSAEQVRAIDALGIEVGSHGMRHRSLAGAGPDVLRTELHQSREILEQLLGAPVRGLCYPYGELSDPAVAAAMRHGYDYAVATWSMARRHRFALPRSYVGEADHAARLRLKQLRHRLTWAGRR